MSQTEVNERAFAIFLLDGLHYLLQQDIQLHEGYMIHFCNRLWSRWRNMSDAEKDPYMDRAFEELRRIRRFSRVDIYREAMREEQSDDVTRNRYG